MKENDHLPCSYDSNFARAHISCRSSGFEGWNWNDGDGTWCLENADCAEEGMLGTGVYEGSRDVRGVCR